VEAIPNPSLDLGLDLLADITDHDDVDRKVVVDLTIAPRRKDRFRTRRRHDLLSTMEHSETVLLDESRVLVILHVG